MKSIYEEEDGGSGSDPELDRQRDVTLRGLERYRQRGVPEGPPSAERKRPGDLSVKGRLAQAEAKLQRFRERVGHSVRNDAPMSSSVRWSDLEPELEACGLWGRTALHRDTSSAERVEALIFESGEREPIRVFRGPNLVVVARRIRDFLRTRQDERDGG